MALEGQWGEQSETKFIKKNTYEVNPTIKIKQSKWNISNLISQKKIDIVYFHTNIHYYKENVYM